MPIIMPTYRFFAKTYGWPPEVVDQLPESAAEWLPLIEQASNRADEAIQEIYNRRNR